MAILGFEIAKSGMNAARNQLNVTAHNLANIGTAGYSRQQAVQVTKATIHSLGVTDRLGSGYMGQGTTIETINRTRNNFLDSEYRNYLSIFNYNSYMSQGYSYIENIINEPSDSALSSNISTFWNSLSELGSKPTDLSARAAFVQSALSFTTAINSISDKTQQLKSQYTQELESIVHKINIITNELSDLNKEIIDLESIGNPANDLRDQRDLLIDELSKLVDIDTYENGNGAISVLAGGKLLVGENTKRQISLTVDENKNSLKVIWSEELDQFEMKGGHLKAALSSINEVITNFENDLNDMITTLANRFNEVHKQGFDLNGDGGLDFFVSSDGEPINIRNLTINKDILNDPTLLALSKDADLDGDNSNLNDLLAIKDEKILTPTGNINVNIGEFYNFTIAKIGLNSKSFQQAALNTKGTLDEVATQKSSVSGVSMDEETANLVMFQQAYNASAKVLQTVSEMLDTLINII